jgi:periplasmic protein TonB
MEEVSPWLDVFTASDIARAAAVDVRDVRAFLVSGRVPTVDGEHVAAGPAVEVVRSFRGGSSATLPRELFQPAFTPHREAGVPLAGSAMAHAVILGAFAFLVGIGPAPSLSQARLDTTRLVFLATPGPGGGGGGGGLKQVAPPPRAELQGTNRMRSPVVTQRVVEGPKTEAKPAPPAPTPAAKPEEPPPPEQKPDPEPQIVAPVATLPADARDRAGLPDGTASTGSRGSGSDGGAGAGAGAGIGEGRGSGIGPGSGGGTGGGPFRPGSGITPPSLQREVKPDYTEEARRRGINGDVELEIVVRSDGSVGDVRLQRGLGAGLDQRAIDAVRQWRFSPALRQGVPVDVLVEVAVEFKLR